MDLSRFYHVLIPNKVQQMTCSDCQLPVEGSVSVMLSEAAPILRSDGARNLTPTRQLAPGASPPAGQLLLAIWSNAVAGARDGGSNRTS
jgi:hypothetical protein